MSVYKPKGSPYWHFDFKIKGNRFHGSTGTGSKEDAKNIEAEHRRRAATEVSFPAQSDMTLDIAFDKYWEEHGKRKKSSSDIKQKLKMLIEGLGKNKTLSGMSNKDITDYIAKRRGKVSDSSVNREITLLRAVLNRAVDNWDAKVRMPNWKAHRLIEPKGRIRSLSADEEKRLLAAAREDFRPFIRFCLMTGARVTSVRKLTWASVDRSAGEIRLEVKSKFTGELHTLPITPEIEAILDSVEGLHPIYVFTYLCVGKVPKRRARGQRYPFARDGWRRTWGKALKDAKIKDFRFHDLRHTAATQMLRATHNLAAVKEVLGHRDISTTMRYAHVLKDDIKAALSRKNSRNEEVTEDETELKVVKSNG